MISALVSSCVRYSTLFYQRDDVTCELLSSTRVNDWLFHKLEH